MKLDAKIKSLKKWKTRKDRLVRKIKFKNFMDGLHFINSVAQEAEKMGHHPDIVLKYDEVEFSLITHDEGKITDKDIMLAKKIDELYRK